MTESTRYDELHPAEFDRRLEAAPVAYLPLGTLEWHGDHLPYGTDGFISGRFFEELAERVGGIVLPPLFLGPDLEETVDGESFYGMDIFGFRGSDPQRLPGSAYWVPDDLFERILRAILEQLERVEFDVVVAHGHGPSTTFVEERRDELVASLALELLTCRRTDDGEGLQVDHAAANETSLMLALQPGLVAMDRLPDDEWPTGVDGEDPRDAATVERGEVVVDAELERMEAVIEAALSRCNSS